MYFVYFNSNENMGRFWCLKKCTVLIVSRKPCIQVNLETSYPLTFRRISLRKGQAAFISQHRDKIKSKTFYIQSCLALNMMAQTWRWFGQKSDRLVAGNHRNSVVPRRHPSLAASYNGRLTKSKLFCCWLSVIIYSLCKY